MVQPPSERVAENLRAILARRRISGREFSQQMGWPATNGARRLNGEQAMTLDEVPRVAATLGIPLIELLDGIEQPQPAEAATA